MAAHPAAEPAAQVRLLMAPLQKEGALGRVIAAAPRHLRFALIMPTLMSAYRAAPLRPIRLRSAGRDTSTLVPLQVRC